ncbi:Fc.00g067150.m01.CDS01 [Cosmosporella sp. VM-42]
MDPQKAPETGPASSSRRRSSGFMPAFAGLHEAKRGSDSAAARRASMTDQEAKGGFISNLFHNNFGKNASK